MTWWSVRRFPAGQEVEDSQDPEHPVRREVWEETGTHLEVDRLAIVHENFFGSEDHPFHEVPTVSA